MMSGNAGIGEDECNFQTRFGHTIRWKKLPVPIYVHESVPSKARKNLEYAVDIWNEAWNYRSGEGLLFEIMGQTTKTMPDRFGDGVNVFYYHADKEVKIAITPGEQGVTRVQVFATNIKDGDIVINGLYHKFHYEKSLDDYSLYTNVPSLSTARTIASTSNYSFWQNWLTALKSFMKKLIFWQKTPLPRGPASKKKRISHRKVDFISLSLHELGHLIGLMHEKKEKQNIMFSKLATGKLRRRIQDIDIERVACSYSK